MRESRRNGSVIEDLPAVGNEALAFDVRLNLLEPLVGKFFLTDFFESFIASLLHAILHVSCQMFIQFLLAQHSHGVPFA